MEIVLPVLHLVTYATCFSYTLDLSILQAGSHKCCSSVILLLS